MNSTALPPLLSLATWAVLALLSLALFMALVRLVRGPLLPDRVIALDLTVAAFLGVSVVFAIRTGQAVYLDVAIVLTVISFLSTVAFALYLEKRAG